MFWLDRGELETDVAGLVAEARGLSPVLSFDVVNNRAFRPRKQGRNHKPGSFAAASWGKGENVFGTVVFQVVQVLRGLLIPSADIDSRFALQERSRLDILLGSPAGGAVQIIRILRK